MRGLLGLLVSLLVACGGSSSPPAPAIGNTATTATPPRASGPIPRDEIARRSVPPVAEIARLLDGAWEGRRYDYDSERGFSGDAGTSAPIRLVFERDGRYAKTDAGCDSSGTYAVRQGTSAADQTAGDLVFSRRRHCRDAEPYDYPMYLHRLDEDLLVLIDGMTAGVSAFRRVR